MELAGNVVTSFEKIDVGLMGKIQNVLLRYNSEEMHISHQNSDLFLVLGQILYKMTFSLGNE